MRNKGKVLLYSIGGITGLMVLILVFLSILKNQYRSKIPDLLESQSLSAAVWDQLSDALADAYRSPTAENLGMLGMVYHSSANYEQASQCYALAVKRNKSERIQTLNN